MANRSRALTGLVALSWIALAPSGAAPAAATDPIAAVSAPALASATPFYSRKFSRRPSPATLTTLGRAIFFEPALSASGKQACATCHDPAHAFGPPNGLAVQLGGPDMTRAGLRTVPSLRYLTKVPAFTEHYFETELGDSIDQGPTGGYTWDGRARTVHEQAQLPLLSPFEMANANIHAVVERVRASPLAAELKQAFGDDVLAEDERAFAALTWALEVFQQSPADFYPYSSKYDAVLRRQARLSDEEALGLEVFNDPGRGNCASCHPSSMREGAFPQFTDFGFIAVGVPRNPEIPANADPSYVDLGLCGPQRTDFADHPDYCGRFRTPTLRNVAIRSVFFHNGAMHDLRKVVDFYARRDTEPGAWYPHRPDGTVAVFDDLPSIYAGNLNRDPPFDRKPGDRPVMSPIEVDAVVAFLQTLTDGWSRPTE
jgi:cytochrome c peroxidase